MTEDEYVLNVIRQKKAQQIDIKDYRLTEIKNVIKKWANSALVDLKRSGSSAKNTAIKGQSDFDLFISLSSSTTGSLKDIYNSLDSFVKSSGIQTRRQNASIGIKQYGLDIDLVPGRVQQGYQNYHSLYLSKKDTWIQTNIDLHINTIVNSGRQDEIVATKIWRELNKLSFPSIYLELTVLQALKNRNKNQPAKNFLTVLDFLANSFVDNKVTDPSSSNNIISDDLYKYEKEEIAKVAKISLNADNWNKIIW